MNVFVQAARTSGLSWLSRRAATQAAKFSVVAYAYLTLFGLIHDVGLEVRTGLDPFAFYGIEDFFLAGARHPGGVLLAVAVPLAMLLTGFVATLVSGGLLRAFQPVYGYLTGPQFAAAWSDQMFAFFGAIYGGFCMFMAAIFLILYVALVPFVSVVVRTDAECSPLRVLAFKSEGDKPARKINVRIVSAAEKFVFVGDLDQNVYSAIRLDEIESISTEAPPSGLRWYCPIVN